MTTVIKLEDLDVPLWLTKEFESGKWQDGTFSYNINTDILRHIRGSFVKLETAVKIKLMFLLIRTRRKNDREWQRELDEIGEIAWKIREPSVVKMAILLKQCGNLDLDEDMNAECIRLFISLLEALKENRYPEGIMSALIIELAHAKNDKAKRALRKRLSGEAATKPPIVSFVSMYLVPSPNVTVPQAVAVAGQIECINENPESGAGGEMSQAKKKKEEFGKETMGNEIQCNNANAKQANDSSLINVDDGQVEIGNQEGDHNLLNATFGNFTAVAVTDDPNWIRIVDIWSEAAQAQA